MPEDGFVITGYRANSVLYTDGLDGDDGTNKQCEGYDPIDLNKIRMKFYQVAQWQLERGGYTYKVDKTEFEALTTKAPTITRGLNVMQPDPDIQSADDDMVVPPTIIPVKEACDCVLTVCNCLELSLRTAYSLTLPIIISGEIHLRFDFGQMLPPQKSQDIFVNPEGDLVMISTEKGPMSAFWRSENPYELREAHVEGRYIHVFVQVENAREAIFEANLPPAFCEDEYCTLPHYQARITWEATPTSRKRRSWFFSLTTNNEVTNKVNNALELSEAYAEQNKLKIDSLDSLLKDTDLNLSKQAETLKNLFNQLCDVNAQSIVQNQLMRIESSIRRNVEFMMDLLSDCAIGTVPSSFSYGTLQKLCMANMDSEICQRLGHRIRMLIKCSVRSIHLLKTKYLLDFELKIPRSFEANYNLYRPITVPTFHKNTTYNHELTGMDDLVVLKYVDSNVTVLLDDCQDTYGLTTCSGSQNHDRQKTECIAGIVNARKNYTCYTESYKNSGTCFARKTDDGVLVLTSMPIEIHHHSQFRVFSAHSSTVEGTVFLHNSPKESLSISCGGILITTMLTDPTNISIHDHTEFSWDDTLTSAINKALIDDIHSERVNTRQLIKRVNDTFDDIHGDFQFKHLSPMGPHKWLWATLFLIALVGIIILILCCCCKGCCGCCVTQVPGAGCLCNLCGACAECYGQWKRARSSVQYVTQLNDPMTNAAFIPNSPTVTSGFSSGSDLSNFLLPSAVNSSTPNRGNKNQQRKLVVNVAPPAYKSNVQQASL